MLCIPRIADPWNPASQPQETQVSPKPRHRETTGGQVITGDQAGKGGCKLRLSPSHTGLQVILMVCTLGLGLGLTTMLLLAPSHVLGQQGHPLGILRALPASLLLLQELSSTYQPRLLWSWPLAPQPNRRANSRTIMVQILQLGFKDRSITSFPWPQLPWLWWHPLSWLW